MKAFGTFESVANEKMSQSSAYCFNLRKLWHVGNPITDCVVVQFLEGYSSGKPDSLLLR